MTGFLILCAALFVLAIGAYAAWECLQRFRRGRAPERVPAVVAIGCAIGVAALIREAIKAWGLV